LGLLIVPLFLFGFSNGEILELKGFSVLPLISFSSCFHQKETFQETCEGHHFEKMKDLFGHVI
jgi:hypothetical protein